MKRILSVLIPGITLAIGIAVGDWHRSKQVKTLEARIERAFQHWDQRVGGTKLWNGEMVDYNLRTFDGGRNWYQIEYDDEWRMKIIGNAEELFPGLIDTVLATEKLFSLNKPVF